MPDLNNFPNYFQAYVWEDKHKLYGYPADSYPDFEWISSLESRFGWLKNNCTIANTAAIYLVQEMIQWGGSQNGVLQKFDDRIGEVNLFELIEDTIANITEPEQAIRSSLNIPGMGLTYASKMLRFLEPDLYGALDSRVRRAINDRVQNVLPNIHDGNINSMTKGYTTFIDYLSRLKTQLEQQGISRPNCCFTRAATQTGWRAADIEAALFSWAESNDP